MGSESGETPRVRRGDIGLIAVSKMAGMVTAIAVPLLFVASLWVDQRIAGATAAMERSVREGYLARREWDAEKAHVIERLDEIRDEQRRVRELLERMDTGRSSERRIR